MKNLLDYKNYVGSIEFSQEDALFFGKVLGIRALISYEGTTARELIDDFHRAVDDYLEECRAGGIVPETAYKGSFNVRISPESHKAAAVAAMQKGITLNQLVSDAIESYIAG